MTSNANPPWHGSAAMQVEERERQRRAALQRWYIDDGAVNSVSTAQHLSVTEAQRLANEHWTNRMSNEEMMRQLNITPQLITRQGPPPFPGGVVDAPPLPRAKVTPRNMISQAVKEVTAEAQNLYVLNAIGRFHDNYTFITNHERVIVDARQEVHRKIASIVAETTDFTTESVVGGWEVRGSVVVMKPDDLRKIIEAVGQRVLDKAVENGFIR